MTDTLPAMVKVQRPGHSETVVVRIKDGHLSAEGPAGPTPIALGTPEILESPGDENYAYLFHVEHLPGVEEADYAILLPPGGPDAGMFIAETTSHAANTIQRLYSPPGDVPPTETQTPEKPADEPSSEPILLALAVYPPHHHAAGADLLGTISVEAQPLDGSGAPVGAPSRLARHASPSGDPISMQVSASPDAALVRVSAISQPPDGIEAIDSAPRVSTIPIAGATLGAQASAATRGSRAVAMPGAISLTAMEQDGRSLIGGPPEPTPEPVPDSPPGPLRIGDRISCADGTGVITQIQPQGETEPPVIICQIEGYEEPRSYVFNEISPR